MKNNKILLLLVAVVIVLLIAVIIAKKKGLVGGEAATKVAVEEVIKRNIVETVSASGKIQSESEVIISPDVSGEIMELPVKEGDKVIEGQLLVKIDPDIQQSNVERLEAALNTSKANCTRIKWWRNRSLMQLQANLKLPRAMPRLHAKALKQVVSK
jgi:HlyD family secretion protein